MANKKKQTGKEQRRTKADVKEDARSSIAWGIILAVLAVLMLAARIDPVAEEKELAKRKKPYEGFSWMGWWNGTSQDEAENKVGTISKLAVNVVPARNDMDMRVFDRINVQDFFFGKEHTVFSRPGLDSYLGHDAIGRDAVHEEVRRARVVQDSLDRRGVKLVILYAPGKVSYLPELLPGVYDGAAPGPMNYFDYIEASKTAGLRHVDIRAWFLSMKGKSKYPLYPPYGSHWSFYGECLMADSVIRFVEKVTEHRLPHLAWTKVNELDSGRYRDVDVLGRAGLSKMPHDRKLGYPEVKYVGAPGASPIPGMVLGDSYARGFVYLSVMRTVFNNGPFWYYYNSRVPEDPNAPEIWELDLEREIMKNRVVIVLCNEHNLKDLGNGFIDDAYRMFTDRETFLRDREAQRVFRTHKKAIRKDEDRMRQLQERSRAEAVPLDSLIDREARAESLRP